MQRIGGQALKTRSRFLWALISILAIISPVVVNGQNETVIPKDAKALENLENDFTFLIASDLGRNGYYDQKPIAEMMGEIIAITGAEFVAALGDVHHFLGVRSVQDPLWQTDFEWIYKHPDLMIP